MCVRVFFRKLFQGTQKSFSDHFAIFLRRYRWGAWIVNCISDIKLIFEALLLFRWNILKSRHRHKSYHATIALMALRGLYWCGVEALFSFPQRHFSNGELRTLHTWCHFSRQHSHLWKIFMLNFRASFSHFAQHFHSQTNRGALARIWSSFCLGAFWFSSFALLFVLL